MSRYVLFTTFFFFFYFLPLSSSQPQLSQYQNATMTHLANLLSKSWNTSHPNPCIWPGVTCSQNSVTRLSLSSLSLSSPAFLQPIYQLDTLESLDLSNNTLTSLTSQLLRNCSRLNGLKLLNVSMNMLSGLLPDFDGFSRLESLDLSRNFLGGEIGFQIDGLPQIRSLNLSFNLFEGSVPTHLGKGMALQELQLSHNKLQGLIPERLFDYGNLTLIDLSWNEFTGQVPNFLTHLPSLTQLNLSNNQLSGTLPSFRNKNIIISISRNKDLVLPPPSSNSSTLPPKRKNSYALVLKVSFGSAALVFGLVVVGIVFLSRRFNLVELTQVIDGYLLTTEETHISGLNFTKAIEAVNSPADIMMKSRYTTYYMAIMPCGMSYCVKKLNWYEKNVQTGNKEIFGQVMEVVARLKNSRIMTPLAYALRSDSAFLFYEYAHIGTLFDFLHKSLEGFLDWPCRYSIALGVAQGLAFLHECTDPVLLLDLSTNSIFLKSLTAPQIADIELCKVIDPTKSTGSFSKVAVGSEGYVPPEYAYTMRVTAAGNVYSFGVVLLELLTGRPSVSEGAELAKWVASTSVGSDAWNQILDSRIIKTSGTIQNQMLSVLKVALACVSVSPAARPTMKNVVRMLLNAR